MSEPVIPRAGIVAGKPDARPGPGPDPRRPPTVGGAAAGPRRRRRSPRPSSPPSTSSGSSGSTRSCTRSSRSARRPPPRRGPATRPARRGAAPGPLDGIPVLIKDNIAVRGHARHGRLAGAAPRPARTTPSWSPGCATAGAVILGKANLSEWANFRSRHSTSGWSTLGGQAVNPHGTGRNPSGSSSGSGVAVAAGLAPLAVGTETDGSHRLPGQRLRDRRHQADPGPGQPDRHRADLAGPGHRGPDGPVGRRRRRPAVRAGRPRTPPTRRPSPAAGRPATTRPSWTPARWPARGWASGGTAPGRGRRAPPPCWTPRSPGCARPVPRSSTRSSCPAPDEIDEPEFAALPHEFKHDLNAYLAGLRGDAPGDLAELIAYNASTRRHGAGPLRPGTLRAGRGHQRRPRPTRLPGARARRPPGWPARRWTAPLAAHRLDAIVSLTANPAWLTDYVLGDHDIFHTSAPAAVAGYPAVTVPAGQCPACRSASPSSARAWSEPRLIALAHAFEQAAPPGGARSPPRRRTRGRRDSLRIWTPGPPRIVPELPGPGPEPRIWDTATGELTRGRRRAAGDACTRAGSPLTTPRTSATRRPTWPGTCWSGPGGTAATR